MMHLQQFYATDCGLAVVAMISGWAYEEILDAAKVTGVFRHNGLSIANMQTLLETFTGEPWTVSRPDRACLLGDHCLRAPRPRVLLVSHAEDDNYRHWLGFYRGRVFDPAFRGHSR